MLTIRDFIYLDVERLKSMLSQMDKGLLESLENQVSHEVGASAGGKGSIPFLFEASGGANYVFHNQHSQTKALHDYIYNLVEDMLRDNHKLISIPQDEELGIISTRRRLIEVAPETSFLLVTGHVNIDDYNNMMRFLRNFDKLEKAITRASGQQQTTTNSSGIRSKGGTNKTSQASDISSQIKSTILPIVEQFYQSSDGKPRLAIKMMPNRDEQNLRLVGNLHPEFLREDIDTITFKYTSAPDAPWHMLAQVAAIPAENSSHSALQMPIPPEAQLEERLHQMFNALRLFERIMTSISYPEIAVTPIAIYRAPLKAKKM